MKIYTKFEVDLGPNEVCRIFMEHLNQLTKGVFVRNGKFYEEDEYRHGSVTDSEVVPDAITKYAVLLKKALK